MDKKLQNSRRTFRIAKGYLLTPPLASMTVRFSIGKMFSTLFQVLINGIRK